MRSSIAKSIYVGAAVLGLAGLSAVTTTTASAKSYATAGAYTALADKSQNVTVTGTNAIYSQPGTVKGAKVVASKATVAKLAASKKSSDTFYAYGTKTTNRGSVYYKIVTMDKEYRGYVYAGKTATVAGGIKAAETMTAATTPARTTGYYLKDVSKNTLWTAPKNTDINAKKVSLYGAAKTDPFTVDKAATKTKEGSLYYHVTDSKDSSISGWIYAGKGYDTTITDNTKQDLGGLSLTVAANAATSDNSVKVVYRDASTKANVGTATWIDGATTSITKAGDTVAATAKNTANQTLVDYIKAAKPANYAVASDYTVTAQYGNTVYVDVTATATSKVALKVDKVDTTTATVVNGLVKNATLTTKDVTVSGFDATTLDGDKTKNVDLAKVETALEAATLTGTKTYYTSDGTAYHYTFALTSKDALATDNSRAVYGDTLNAYYTATLVKGTANSTSSNDSWIA